MKDGRNEYSQSVHPYLYNRYPIITITCKSNIIMNDVVVTQSAAFGTGQGSGLLWAVKDKINFTGQQQ